MIFKGKVHPKRKTQLLSTCPHVDFFELHVKTTLQHSAKQQVDGDLFEMWKKTKQKLTLTLLTQKDLIYTILKAKASL